MQIKLEQEFLERINVHKGILFKVSRLYMDTKADQEDLYQEMICQLWKSYTNFLGASQFSTWMYRVCINTAITYFKKNSIRAKSTTRLDNEKHQFQLEEASFEVEEQLKYLYGAIHELNDVEKALIFLFLEGFSHLEIANNLGISEGNARVRLNRTKNKLQDIIKRKGYEF
ncbi:sigma-70 family RNA polymerase sigma factor [Myroides sp. DF42-4-2]|uniref:RNA polymerase sigma factor n=2 Tax=unclassified Myroides TaxID=2642485 RepID=UPI002574F5DC|nr:sigma-70 family RNA polymerase sigma factor [Myroides sp. DF42-4-2]MDM1407755.1 sigma-70 family RNA polymerase sigma factor [Myroides sp. DF42-4-2]